jgi:hypothetical protein
VLARPRRQAVRIAVPADLDAVVDPVGLDRMLSNLVANALKYGEPLVTVSATRRDTHLRLAVEDRGQVFAVNSCRVSSTGSREVRRHAAEATAPASASPSHRPMLELTAETSSTNVPCLTERASRSSFRSAGAGKFRGRTAGGGGAAGRRHSV